MAAKLSKAAQSQITKLKEQLAKAKALGAQRIADQKLAAKERATKIKARKVKKRQVYAYGQPKKTKKGEDIPGSQWEGASPKKLTIYKVRLMLDEQQIGFFGPYATIRAASADAKNILRMHVGPGFKIEEIGVDEPLLRSDGNVKVYFHPSVYSAQATDKGVLTAQVIEQGGEAQRKKAFVKKYNPSRRNPTRIWRIHFSHVDGPGLATRLRGIVSRWEGSLRASGGDYTATFAAKEDADAALRQASAYGFSGQVRVASKK